MTHSYLAKSIFILLVVLLVSCGSKGDTNQGESGTDQSEVESRSDNGLSGKNAVDAESGNEGSVHGEFVTQSGDPAPGEIRVNLCPIRRALLLREVIECSSNYLVTTTSGGVFIMEKVPAGSYAFQINPADSGFWTIDHYQSSSGETFIFQVMEGQETDIGILLLPEGFFD